MNPKMGIGANTVTKKIVLLDLFPSETSEEVISRHCERLLIKHDCTIYVIINIGNVNMMHTELSDWLVDLGFAGVELTKMIKAIANLLVSSLSERRP